MAKQVSTFNYRKHCIAQGRDNIPTLTRKQKKALKQHDAAKNKRDGIGSYKLNSGSWYNSETNRFEPLTRTGDNYAFPDGTPFSRKHLGE